MDEMTKEEIDEIIAGCKWREQVDAGFHICPVKAMLCKDAVERGKCVTLKEYLKEQTDD